MLIPVSEIKKIIPKNDGVSVVWTKDDRCYVLKSYTLENGFLTGVLAPKRSTL